MRAIFAINDPLGSKIHVWYLNKRGYLSGELFVQSFQRPDNERSSIVGWFRHRNDGWRRCVIVCAGVCGVFKINSVHAARVPAEWVIAM